jgi:hypothetical protein
MSHALRADSLLIKPTAGARPASPCTPGRFIPKARNRGLTPDEPRATRTTTSLATAPDGPTKRPLQTPERRSELRAAEDRHGTRLATVIQLVAQLNLFDGTAVRIPVHRPPLPWAKIDLLNAPIEIVGAWLASVLSPEAATRVRP